MKPEDIVKEIIKEQSLIIGEPLAKQMATNSGVVKFNSSKLDDISVTSTDSPTAIEKLINSYKTLFGPASVEVCLNVIRRIPNGDVSQFLPESVKSKLAVTK